MRPARRSGPPEPTLLLDENISGTRVHGLLDAAGISAVRFRDLLPTGSPDIEVVNAASLHGLVIVTRDRDFRYHPAVRAAFRNGQARAVFVVAKGAGRPTELARMLTRARRKIAIFATENAPALATLDGSGALKRVRLR